jgi:hypothetical protein
MYIYFYIHTYIHIYIYKQAVTDSTLLCITGEDFKSLFENKDDRFVYKHTYIYILKMFKCIYAYV